MQFCTAILGIHHHNKGGGASIVLQLLQSSHINCRFSSTFLIFSVLGDPRVNQNPALLALGIIFYRWHNLQAAVVQTLHPDWNDEDIFQAARRRVIATLQVTENKTLNCS